MNRRTLLLTTLLPFVPLPKEAIPEDVWKDVASSVEPDVDPWQDFDYRAMPTDGLAWRDRDEDD